tara:strand:- start:2796 stop:3191 length:396 start_codon:yes stop_codon:yes gene_type:complete
MIRVILYTPSEIPQSSYVYAGFFELEKENYLEYEVRISLINKLESIIVKESKIIKTISYHINTSFYKLMKSQINIYFAIAINDARAKLSYYTLEKFKFLIKRYFNTKVIERLPEKYKKITTGLEISMQIST